MNAVNSDKLSSKVSVLMTVYNAERYLNAAVESVLTQTFENFELLALDDGSTDESLKILKEYQRKDARVRVLERAHRGIGLSRNDLVKEARGFYLAVMDADDISLPDRLETQVKFLDSSDGHVVVGGWVEQINTLGQPIGIIRPPLNHKEIDEAHLRGRCSIWHSAAMIQAKALSNVGGYDHHFAPTEDLDLWLRLAEIGKVANVPQVVMQYRVHAGGISENERDQQLRLAQFACETAWARRGIEGRFEANEHWRPGKDKASRHKFALQYGWVAWNHNHRSTWWTYTCEAIWLRPFSVSTWKLLFFGFFRVPDQRCDEK
jgi:glycosyltransferase involved in cell wall biosynthesis